MISQKRQDFFKELNKKTMVKRKKILADLKREREKNAESMGISQPKVDNKIQSPQVEIA